MSLYPGNFGKENLPSVNQELMALKGDLTTEEAHLALGKFLTSNIPFTYNLLTGGELFPFQTMKLNLFLKKDYVIDISSRGISKSWIAAVFCIIYCICNPGFTIIILAPSFRQSKNIFNYIEKVMEHPDAQFLRSIWSCRKESSQWTGYIGDETHGSKVIALPLAAGGGKIRGPRAQCIIIDEALEFPEVILKEVVQPFLVTSFDPIKKQKISDLEDKLVKKGLLENKDRIKFPNPKLILLSSGCFQFQDLYQRVEQYIDYATNPEYKELDLSYAFINLSCEFAPEKLLQKSIIEDARRNMSESQFNREYMAQCVDDSSGYFRMAKMEACTETREPIIELVGHPGAEYILAIDPNYKDSENSDHFAMCLSRLDADRKLAHIVHNYALAGVSLDETAKYLHYILKSFNICYLIIDDGGADQFLSYVNGHSLFKSDGIFLSAFEYNFDPNDIGSMIKAKNSYNKSAYRIVHRQSFGSEWIQESNESLQTAFDTKRLWFAAAPAEERQFKQLIKSDVPIEELRFNNNKRMDNAETKMVEFIDHQVELIKLCKQEAALIEITITSQGKQTFDLPRSMRHMKGPNKPRKDSYTAMLLNNWGVKKYKELKSDNQKVRVSSFRPRFIG